MKVTVQVTLEADDGTPTVVHEVFTLQRGSPRARHPRAAAGRGQGPAGRGAGPSGRRRAGPQRPGRPGRVPGLRDAAAPQGRPPDRDADPVRHAAPRQPALVALRLPPSREPNLQPPGRDTPRADHARSCPTWRPSSPGWSPTGCRPSCWASSCRSGGGCTPPRCGCRSRPSRSVWRTSSATSTASFIDGLPDATGRSCPARTCRWSSAWMAATCTPASNAPAGTAGLR